MQPPPGPEDPSALAAELRALVGKLKRRLREQADTGDLTPSQTAVLLRLERAGAATVAALARAEGVRPQSMSTIVAALEAAGHVHATPDPADGRQSLIALTETARRQIVEGRALRQDWLSRRIAASLTAPEQAALATAVRLLTRIVED